jgi:hypothetical protein
VEGEGARKRNDNTAEKRKDWENNARKENELQIRKR